MQVHFTMVAEPTLAYTNMARLCAWSIRNKAGTLANSPVTVVFNDKADPLTVKYLRDKLDVQTLVFPRLDPKLYFLNKYNMAKVPGLAECDWVINLDCDTVVANDLGSLFKLLEPQTDCQFGGVPVNEINAWGLDQIFRKHSNYTKQEIQNTRHPWFPCEYPYFNSGVIAAKGSLVESLSNETINIACKLFKEMAATNINPLHWLRIKWNRKICKTKSADKFVLRPFFTRYYAEQVALTAAVLKLRVPYCILPHIYNWRKSGLNQGEETPIRILHYLSALFPVEREKLFTGDWLQKCAQSNNPGWRELYTIINQYNETTHN